MVFQVPSRLMAVRPPALATKGEEELEPAWPEEEIASAQTNPSRVDPPTIVRFIGFPGHLSVRAAKTLRSRHQEDRILQRHDQAGTALARGRHSAGVGNRECPRRQA